MSLVIPLGDFDHLPLKLGCSLHRGADRLELAAERDGCWLVFETSGDQAELTQIVVRDDPEGRFMRDVVATLVMAYQGDLEAHLEWTPARDEPRLVIREGETNHPLVSARREEPLDADEISVSEVDQWLEDARQAWREYRTLKGQGEPDRQ